MVVESAAALPVDDRGGVIGVGLGDSAEVGAAWEPPSELAVEVLDLAALPRRVGLTEPAVDRVADGECFPLGPLRSLVERQRAEQVRWDLFACFNETGEDVDGGLAKRHRDRDRVAGDAFGQPDHRGTVVGADDLIRFPMARL